MGEHWEISNKELLDRTSKILKELALERESNQPKIKVLNIIEEQTRIRTYNRKGENYDK